MITFLSISLGVFFLSTVFFSFMFFRIKSKLKKIDIWKQEYDKISTHRKGFYTENIIDSSAKKNQVGTLYIYVTEKERFTNGYSEIEFSSFNVDCDIPDLVWFTNSIKGKFVSLKKTSDIEWLENDDFVKHQRKLKMDQLKEIEES